MKQLTAFLVWAYDTDRMSMPISEALKQYQQNAEGMLRVYTDPSDPTLFIKRLVGSDPIAFFEDYILSFAKSRVLSGLDRYNENITTAILNYKRQ